MNLRFAARLPSWDAFPQRNHARLTRRLRSACASPVLAPRGPRHPRPSQLSRSSKRRCCVVRSCAAQGRVVAAAQLPDGAAQSACETSDCWDYVCSSDSSDRTLCTPRGCAGRTRHYASENVRNGVALCARRRKAELSSGWWTFAPLVCRRARMPASPQPVTASKRSVADLCMRCLLPMPNEETRRHGFSQ